MKERFGATKGPSRPTGVAPLAVEQRLDARAIALPRLQPRPIRKHDDPVALKPGVKLADPLGVHDRRAVDADEAITRKPLLQLGKRRAVLEDMLPHMDAHEIARRFDPVEVEHQEIDQPLAHPHGQAVGSGPCR